MSNSMPESANHPRSRLPELLVQAYALLPMELRMIVDAVPLYRSLTTVWAHQPNAPFFLPTQGLIWAHRLHLYNFRLWHVEDSVRRPGASESFIAQSKRAIDTLNQQRHEQIEHLDTWLFAYLYDHTSRCLTETELHSETPGNLLDRLSILTLKVYYMGREAERQDATGVHRQTCRQRLAILAEQHNDMYGCLCRLCLDLWSGRKMFKIYRQFKMYNDPDLNPEIYRYRASTEA
jgi:hypothetical protein